MPIRSISRPWPPPPESWPPTSNRKGTTMTDYLRAQWTPPPKDPFIHACKAEIERLRMDLADAYGCEREWRRRCREITMELVWLQRELHRLDPRLFKSRYPKLHAWQEEFGKPGPFKEGGDRGDGA